ncbi:MAG: aminomethyl-transferring glycine dehydrogenase subunit GcvPA [Actinomycetota bacterium]
MSNAGDFVPHTTNDIDSMLAVVGTKSIDDLFSVIPDALRDPAIDLIPALAEPEVVAHVAALASRNAPSGGGRMFLGGGLYDHYVPAAVRALVSRGEFATAYTPYQAEASQGTLQALFEFQTMIAELFGLTVSNASLYDGGTALVEAINLAAMRRESRRVLVCPGVNPRYRRVLDTYAGGLGIEVVVLPETDFGTEPGSIAEATRDEHVLAVVVQQPNVYGFLEDAAEIAAAASEAGAVVIGLADPMTLGVVAPPGEWGAQIAAAEGQAFGNPLAFGGQCVGLFACDDAFARHMPGRLVGETVDADGRRGYVLTLQAREQHIKREKAGSNICTNQTLFALSVAVHLAWLGPEGLRKIGEISSELAHAAAERIEAETSFRVASSRPFVRELALRGPKTSDEVIVELRHRGVWAGPRSVDHADVFNIAFTERRTTDDIDALVEALREVGKS